MVLSLEYPLEPKSSLPFRQPFPGSGPALRWYAPARPQASSPNPAAEPCERQGGACVSFEEAALNELVAQLVEQRPFKAWVVRSSRTELTILSDGSAAFPEISRLESHRDSGCTDAAGLKKNAVSIRRLTEKLRHKRLQFMPRYQEMARFRWPHRTTAALAIFAAVNFFGISAAIHLLAPEGFSIGDHLVVRQGIPAWTG